MSKQAKGSKGTSKPMSHADVASALRASPPEMDDLRQMRLERRVLASTEQGVGAPSPSPRSSGDALPMRRVLPSARLTFGVLALAAAALLGYLLRGGMESTSTNPVVEGAHFALIRAEGTTDGVLAEGANMDTRAGERGSIEVGDVTAHLAERTSLSLESDDPDDVAIRLESGSTEFAFHPHRRGAQHLTVTTPNARVEVVGTVFTVRVDGAGTEVSVTEGTVRVVRLNGGEASLVHAGDTLLVRSVSTNASASSIDVTRGPAPTLNAPALVLVETITPAARAPVISAPLEAAQVARVVHTETATTPAVSARVMQTQTPPPALVAAPAQAELAQAAELERPDQQETELAQTELAQTELAQTELAQTELSQTEPALGTEPAQGAEEALALAAPRPSVSRQRRGLPSAATDLASPHVRRAAVVTRGPQLSQPPTAFAHERRVWGRVDDLQSNGQYEQSLPLLIAIENEGTPSDRAEALYHRARTLDVALHRPAQALALYRRYLNAHPEGLRAREAYVRVRRIESQP